MMCCEAFIFLNFALDTDQHLCGFGRPIKGKIDEERADKFRLPASTLACPLEIRFYYLQHSVCYTSPRKTSVDSMEAI
jgi:hypothetical protein